LRLDALGKKIELLHQKEDINDFDSGPRSAGNFREPISGRDYVIEIVCRSLPRSAENGQPDFGTLTFNYVPAEKCVELKSLKLYLQQFRNQAFFTKNATNRILDDLVATLQPAA